MTQAVIDQFRQAVSKRESYTFSVGGTTSDFRINLSQTITLNPILDYEIALIRFEAYNSIYNITEKNNNLRYNNGTSWKTITLAPGAYEIDGLNSEIQRQMKSNNDVKINNGHVTYYFKLYPNMSTLKSVIELSNNFKVDFNDKSSSNNFRKLLGFDEGVYSNAYNESQNIIHIQPFNNLFINTDLCTNSYVNGININVLRDFTTNLVPVGYKVILEPPKPIFLPVPKHKMCFSDYRIWLSDETGKIVDFNGEHVTITLWLRSV